MDVKNKNRETDMQRRQAEKTDRQTDRQRHKKENRKQIEALFTGFGPYTRNLPVCGPKKSRCVCLCVCPFLCASVCLNESECAVSVRMRTLIVCS